MNSMQLLNRKINKFIILLVNILNSEEFVKIISWSVDGSIIEIHNINDFKCIILYKYFKYTNLSNFIRQLNLYNFKKVITKDQNSLFYCNPLFNRDTSAEGLLGMVRNKVTKKIMSKHE